MFAFHIYKSALNIATESNGLNVAEECKYNLPLHLLLILLILLFKVP